MLMQNIMKPFPLIFALLFFCNAFFIQAQCIVKAGNNIHICIGDSPVKINASILQGKQPFTYLWSINNSKLSSLKYILDDSTKLTPNLKSVYPANTDVYLHLTAKDSTGAICTDSIIISTSQFATDLDATPKFISNDGDHITLCSPLHSFGGFKPWKDFKWTPSQFISGSDSGSCMTSIPLYKKDCDTVGYGIYGPYVGIRYRCIAKDARGCSVWDGNDVAFWQPNGINEILNSKDISVYPNPSNNSVNIKLINGEEILEVTLMDISGKIILSEKIYATSYVLEKGNLSSGIFLLPLKSKSGKNFKTKILFE